MYVCFLYYQKQNNAPHSVSMFSVTQTQTHRQAHWCVVYTTKQNKTKQKATFYSEFRFVSSSPPPPPPPIKGQDKHTHQHIMFCFVPCLLLQTPKYIGVYIYTNTHIHTSTNTHTHTYIHTQTHTSFYQTRHKGIQTKRERDTERLLLPLTFVCVRIRSLMDPRGDRGRE